MNVISQVALGTFGLGLWSARSVLILSLLNSGDSAPKPEPSSTPTSTPTASASAVYVNPNEEEQDDDDSNRRSPTPRPSSSSPKPKLTPKRTTLPPPPVEGPDDAYYANCAEARRAGAAPIYAGEPGYRLGLDRNRDGVACE